MDNPDRRQLRIEDAGFLALVLLVSIGFAWLLTPFFGAILWGIVLAILFSPVNRWLVARLGGRRNLAASLSLLLILAVAILPALVLGLSLIEQAAALYAGSQSGRIDPSAGFDLLRHALPRWATDLLAPSGLTDFEAARKMFASTIASALQSIASHALLFGQGAMRFLASIAVMLYLTYFLLRDGRQLGRRIGEAVPLKVELRDALVNHFVIVVRATMKGTVVVAVLQGLVGGVIFWFLGIPGPLLWGLLMGFFSLVPAVGTGVVWVPMAIYLLVTGSVWEGLMLTGCGIFVIGLIDNLLRPVLVGKDTRMPDFVVLIATLAGLDIFGLNGFIIGPMIAALFIAVWKIVSEHRSAAVA